MSASNSDPCRGCYYYVPALPLTKPVCRGFLFRLIRYDRILQAYVVVKESYHDPRLLNAAGDCELRRPPRTWRERIERLFGWQPPAGETTYSGRSRIVYPDRGRRCG